MSFINKDQFEKRFFTFHSIIDNLVEVNNRKVQFTVLRHITSQNIKLDRGVLLTPNRIYISKDLNQFIITEHDVLRVLNDRSRVVFQKKQMSRNVFNPEERSLEMTLMKWSSNYSNRDCMKVLDMDPFLYFEFLNQNNKFRSRFYPNESELSVYVEILKKVDKIGFPSGFMTKDNVYDMCREGEQLKKLVKNFHHSQFLVNRMRIDDKDIMTEEGTKTLFTEMVSKELDSSSVRKWFKTRHNMFGVAILQEMEWEIPNKFDVNIMDMFDYHDEDCTKTPDYSLNTEDTLYLFDFAVTSVSVSDIAHMKMDKYALLVEKLSLHLKKEVKFIPLVWSMTDKDSFYLPDFMENIRMSLMSNELLSMMYKMQIQMSGMKNYDLYSKNLNEFEQKDDVDWDSKMMYYENLINGLTKIHNLSGKKTYDVSDSRLGLEKKEMKCFKDMNFFEEANKLSQMDHNEYKSNVMRQIKNIVKERTIPRRMRDMFTVDKEGIKKKIKMDKENQEILRLKQKQSKSKIPKIFKFPYFRMDQSKEENLQMPYLFNFQKSTEDGTQMFNSHFEPDIATDTEYLEDGIGFNEEEDLAFFDNLYLFLTEEECWRNESVESFCPAIMNEDFYHDLVRSKLWYLIYSISDLMENLCYMERRRYIFNESKGQSVAKNFGNYILLMDKGSKLTAEKQVRYKILINKDKMRVSDSLYFHNFHKFDNEYMQTKWLTISITDIRHFSKMREVCMGLASDYYDKLKEKNKSEKIKHNILDRSFVFTMMILLEHKRGTSTSLQLNRYLLHSSCSYATDRMKLLDDINSNPIRSRLESYVRVSQMNWYLNMLDKYDKLNYERVSNMMSTDTDHDRMYFPSFFDLNLEQEFSMMMNEMYLCNLFDKESGFQDHRIKQIVAKMTEAEIHFQKIKKEKESMGNIDDLEKFWNSKDELHKFDSKFVVSATKRFFDNKMNKMSMLDAYMTACTETVDSAMMMTSSLTGGNYHSEVLRFKDKVIKTKSFLSLFEELEKLPTHLLIGMTNVSDVVEAIFTIFPKAQIGGPREILIQSVMLRIMVKFLETISKKMCEKHSKEMLTKDKQKSQLQSSMMSKHKELMMMLKKKGKCSLYASFNSDATKWAPGFMMEHFMHFIYNWDIDEELKDFLCVVTSSFSHKVILTPDSLMRKWERKSNDEKEYVTSIQKFREMSMESSGSPILESGMGQGMLHFLSSFYHVVMDDMVDEMIQELLMDLFSVRMSQTSMISSDDKTKMFIMMFDKPEYAEEAMVTYLFSLDSIYRLANIHTNWKKSGLQFVLTEFNSLFSIGKRMCWATIKDIYTSNSIPDLTAPEEAVKFMLSSIRRCFEHGVYLTTIKCLLNLARNQLMRYYKIDKVMMESLKMLLKTDEFNMPYQLGFIPTDFMVETLLFGCEIHMFKKSNSNEMNMFYKGLYTANAEHDLTRSRHYIPFDETGSGKFWIELPLRLDKRLIEMKNNFYNEIIKMPQKEVIKNLNKNALNVNLSAQDHLKHMMFKESYFVGMNRKYEFQETMVVHSLIRALQLSKSKAIIYPKTKEQVDMEDKMHDPNISKDDKKKLWTLMMADGVDLLDFIKKMKSRGSMKSSLFLMEGLREIMEMAEKVKMELDSFLISKRYSHPVMRDLRFNLGDMKSSFNKTDLINYIFDSSSDFRNTTSRAFHKMCKMFGAVEEEIFKNPFKFIREKFKDQEYCYKSFVEFMTFNSKISGDMKVRMLSDFPDSGNIRINLINLYRSKTSPVFILDYPKNYMKHKEDSDFISKLSLGMDPSSRLEERPKIKMEDNKLTRSRKIFSYGANIMVDCNMMLCDRLFYKIDKKKDVTNYYWTDFSFLCKIEERYNKRETRNNLDVSIWAYDKNSVEDNSNFLVSVERFLMDNPYYGINFKTNMVLSENERFRYNIMGKDLKFMAKVRNYVSRMKLSFSIQVINKRRSWRKMDEESVSFPLMDDNYSVDTSYLKDVRLTMTGLYDENILDAVRDPPTVEVLDSILRQKGWTNNNLFQEEMDLTAEDMRNADMTFICKDMSQKGVMDQLEKLMPMTLLMAEEEKPEEMKLNENFFKLMGSLQMAMEESLTKPDSSDDTSENVELMEMTSISKIIEKVVSSSVNSYLMLNPKMAKKMLKMAEEKSTRDKFHNLMAWLIKKEYPSITDSMIMMIYNIKLKEMSQGTFISPSTKIKIMQPSQQTKDLFKRNPVFVKVTEELNEMLSMTLNEF